MDKIVVKRREFEIVEILSNNSFKCIYKNKFYLIKKFTPKTQEAGEYTFALEKLEHSGIATPKLKFIDKKTGYSVREFIEGINVLDYVIDHDFPEWIYSQLFINAYMAKVAGLTINYSLDKWMIKDEKLIYIGEEANKFNEAQDLIKKYLRIWFNTDELNQYLHQRGIMFDKKRLKNQYEVNKEIVLMTCKYYR